ncbi:MAG: hypothetical protein JWQ71_2254 [Pedosphaera sp.]|nr:hypothetical protein [Pedosphaera sp.]
MKRLIISLLLILGWLMPLFESGCVVVPPIPPPPAPVVETIGPPLFLGAIWVPGVWVWHEHGRRWEWHRGHWR